MIRHRPYGSEHPYAATPDQRTPTIPEIGQQVTLGVLAAANVTAVTCLWTEQHPDGTTTTTELPLSPHLPEATALAEHTGGDGHLATAQAQSDQQGGHPWQVNSPPIGDHVRYSYRFRSVNEHGATRQSRSHTIEPVQWSPQALGSTLSIDTDRLIDDSISWRRSVNGVDRVRFALRLEPGERVVGFGERFDRLDQRGHALDAVVFEQYKSQGAHGRTYLPMPFAHIISDHGPGWGFHVRTSRRSWYDVGASDPDRLIIEVELAGTQAAQLNVAIYRGSPAEVLNTFLTEVGRPEELPAWVFRLWASGNEWNTQDLVMARMDSHRQHDIPVGAVVIEAWSDEEGITIFRDATYAVNGDGKAHIGSDFTYHGAWPDPAAMIAELHTRGIKVILWQIPLQKMRPHPKGQARADADAMINNHHAVLEADGRPYRNRGWWFPQALMPDLSVQPTRDWWTEKRRYLLTDLDVDGFKTDGGEHAWGHDLQYADGRRGDEGNNLFPVHYARAFGDLLRSAGKAPVTFSRAGFTGTQAHGIVWAGDENSTWEAFRSSITAGLTASACGILYWGWDLAGFSGPLPDPELYLRAAAAATFMPIMQYHSEFNHHRPPLRDRTPWHIQNTSGDERVLPVFRQFAHLRDALVPYLAEQARQSTNTARPLMRALFFDHPDDPTIWQHPHQYLLGDDLIVNPVTAPDQAEWTTYLPAGQWVDIWTGETIPGLAPHTRKVPITEIPVYCRADAWSQMARLIST
ncbi:TIM-barrel domain-containing protein [Nakamurella sp. PAMC28650]|uniref:glycoside hydrolase family 31 protein n=1 Tax=Nakamurella sp. PAMC28650 TaxID=2762325 RepID=UPI00164E3116|nr:TIM-barrel domain-containing protein [Nakamurella sp. PAMC28650]QNK81601.1 glycoside hydrolase family 31 [Nakamurella sp. PAMC28650]